MTSRVRSSGNLPEGYIPFRQVREELPTPELFVVSDAVTLEALHLPGPEPGIVFVHGGLGSLWNPFPQLYAFRGERALLTYALAGNGGSSTRPEQTIEGHVADLKNLTDFFGLDRPIVHGHSYGSAIAIEYAKEHPCRGVVLHAGGDHDLTPAWEKPLLRLFMALRLYRVVPETILMQTLAQWAACHKDTPRSLIEDFLHANPMPRRRSAWSTVAKAFWGYDGRSDIDRVEVPALVIHGPADQIVSIEVARGTGRRLPHGEFQTIDRSGHISMAERPAEYSQLLHWFIESSL
ncbi:alpha/beta fold hydrolase [Salinibacter sp.]|uniref:alpha/beta fold hydrolase n=1 Tax=Salinibacter sp. TaxID=2065818 RepID=UPI0021E953FA|nr:alpha/beta hydrolase [Salinibacter sp.]